MRGRIGAVLAAVVLVTSCAGGPSGPEFTRADGEAIRAMVDDYAAALAAAGVPHEFHRYDGADHAFQSFNNEECYNHQASEDAWTKVLEFLHRNLG